MNTLNLFGRLTQNPVQRTTEYGDVTCYFKLAVPRGYRKIKEGEEKKHHTDFIPCVSYRGLAKTLLENLKKGDRITVSGRIQSYSVKTDEGPRTRLICVVDKFDFAGDSKKENEIEDGLTVNHVSESDIPTDVQGDISDDELPF